MTPSPSPISPLSSEAEIRDIAPPVDVFPYPPWMVALVAIVAATLLGLVVWMIVRWWRNRPAAPPPSAAVIALRELEALRQRAGEIEPYSFSIEVSDVLRTFIGAAKFQLPATRQTSSEFLAAISESPIFSSEDRALLTRFLEKADMIKFARVDATSADNAELVESALAFVRGGER